MFKKILIANRGEIACRVIKTARRMGIKTVAVYSDADLRSLHVEMADEAVHIGAPAAAESYLSIEKIIAACKHANVDAVHPGYGFLSERAAFPRALAAAGIIFVGPNPHAIDAMGDKIESKKAAAAAGVSTVPGYMGIIENADDAVKIAIDIGYPVMIKASAGGGGKGMRIAHSDTECREGFALAKAEAKASFGDDRLFLEKFIVNPRHIEIQVLGDKHGNVIHLGERECSIQRRNQKVIEEAPSPLLNEATRQKMGEQAVALAKAVNYDSAGTVEFVAAQDQSFFFLEMNTRLQVEHPVTELVTGVDLVEQMIRVAAGEKLSLAQKDVKLNGWAIESRVYAEDPYRNFLPSTGRLIQYRPPAEQSSGGVTVRNDTGVYEGGEISIWYDPMIAKLCTHAPTRAEAIAAMATALDSFVVTGIQHNIPFVSAIMANERWKAGLLSTGFIAEEFPEGFKGAVLNAEATQKLARAATILDHIENSRKRAISGQMNGRKVNFETTRHVKLDMDRFWPRDLSPGFAGPSPEGRDPMTDLPHSQSGKSHHESLPPGEGPAKPGERSLGSKRLQNWHQVEVDAGFAATTTACIWSPGNPLLQLADMVVQVSPLLNGYRLSWRGLSVEARVYTAREAALARLMPEKKLVDTTKKLLCPMPGLVVSLAVKEGQDVKAGDTLAIVEAMKMQNVLRAERDVRIKKINAKAGDSLGVDAVIMEFA